MTVLWPLLALVLPWLKPDDVACSLAYDSIDERAPVGGMVDALNVLLKTLSNPESRRISEQKRTFRAQMWRSTLPMRDSCGREKTGSTVASTLGRTVPLDLAPHARTAVADTAAVARTAVGAPALEAADALALEAAAPLAACEASPHAAAAEGSSVLAMSVEVSKSLERESYTKRLSPLVNRITERHTCGCIHSIYLELRAPGIYPRLHLAGWYAL